MFNYSLKRRLLAINMAFIVAISSFTGTMVANSSKEDLQLAQSIVQSVKTKFINFFNTKDRRNNIPYWQHINGLRPVLTKIKNLAAKYKNSTNERDKTIYTMLSDLDGALHAIYKVLTNPKYTKSAIKLGLTLKKTLNKYTTSNRINRLHSMVSKLKMHLTPNELTELKKVVEMVINLGDILPNQIVCLKALKQRLKSR